MHGGWQAQADEHFAAPRILQVFSKRLKDSFGRLLFQPLQDEGGGLGGLRLEQQMEMVRHQHPADEQKIQLLTHLLEPLDKTVAKTLGEKNGRTAVGAGGDKLQLTRAVS